MKNRLVTFGCSYTYGQGLKDCHIEPNLPGPNPSKFAWPSLLASKLNYECVNLGTPSFSNLAILNSILNYKFLPNDTVVVMWTFKTRDMEFKDSENVEHYGRWKKHWISKQNIYNLIMRGYMQIHHAKCFLENIGLKYYFLDADIYFNFTDDIPDWLAQIPFVKFDFRKYEYYPPIGLDNLHPGPMFHQKAAETVFNEINHFH